VRVMRWSVGLAVGLTVLLLAACSGDDPGATSTINVDMEDNFYSRDVTRIGVGDTVNFRNRGVVPHNAIDVEGTWSTGLADGGDLLDLQDPGESVAITFEEEGVYTYYCSLHATSDGQEGMVATLVVGDVDYQAAADAPAEPVREWTGVTRQVPEEYPTIQNAVDAAEPGDLVLISPAPESSEYLADDGAYVYKEQVDVTTPYITIRGTDRNAVIIDGEHERTMAINVQAANGVAVENLTARNATGNGIYWTSLEGFRGSYLTAYNNGIYGIYSYDASDGLFEHSYASGSQDAGFYIGQCDPCDSIITGVIAEHNGLGYSGTNSSHVYLVDSVWRHNIAGIVPNTLDSQRLPPFGNVTIVGNLIHDNDSREAPSLGSIWPTFGNGVVLAGGMDSLVERNRIVNHERGGVAVIPNLSRNFWMSGGNVVRDNVITGSGYGDLTLHGPALGGNCFGGNDHQLSVPAGLERVAGCGPDAVAGAHADARPRPRWLPAPVTQRARLHLVADRPGGGSGARHDERRRLPPDAGAAGAAADAGRTRRGGRAGGRRVRVVRARSRRLRGPRSSRGRRGGPHHGRERRQRALRHRAALHLLRDRGMADAVQPVRCLGRVDDDRRGPSRGPDSGRQGRLDGRSPSGPVRRRRRVPPCGTTHVPGLAAVVDGGRCRGGDRGGDARVRDRRRPTMTEVINPASCGAGSRRTSTRRER
jgi:plastocyanin